MKKTLITAVILFCSIIYAQDSTRSLVVKNNFSSFTPIIKIKYPEFSISAGYYLVKSANEGNASSEHELALRYLFGKGFEVDTAKAVYWIKKAVAQKLPAACFNYGIMLLNQAGVEWNPFEAYKNFLIAADKGMPEAEMLVGLFYLDNLIINKDINKAVEWIGKAAKAKYKPAEEVLAEVKTNEGRFIDLSAVTALPAVEKDVKEETGKDISFEWAKNNKDTITASIEDVREDDLLKKPYHTLKQFFNVKKSDFLEAKGDTTSAKLIQQAIKWGNPEAIMLNGLSYEKGISYKKDLIFAASNYFRAYRLGINRAANLLLKLASENSFIDNLTKMMDKGDLEAVYVWSAIIALNYNTRFTEEQSIEFLKKASEKGHIQSMVELGLCYYNGRGVAQDREKALELWQKAADLGCEDARERIAFNSILTDSDKPAVKDNYEYLLKAYNNGSLLAETAIAYCYEKGIVVKENKAEANKIYRDAVKRGSEVAANSLKRMYDALRPGSDEYKIY